MKEGMSEIIIEGIMIAGLSINLCGLFYSCSNLVEVNMLPEYNKAHYERSPQVERIIVNTCNSLKNN